LQFINIITEKNANAHGKSIKIRADNKTFYAKPQIVAAKPKQQQQQKLQCQRTPTKTNPLNI